MNDDISLAGFEGEAWVSKHSSDLQCVFVAGNGFVGYVTNPQALPSGRTVGDENRAQLHDFLDRWIDSMVSK